MNFASLLATVGVMLIVATAAGAQGAAQSTPDVDALIGLARSARDQGRAVEAAGYFREADRRRPLDGSLLVEYFWVAHRADFAAAAAIGDRVLRRTPREDGVRDGLIGLAAGTDEARVRSLAEAGRGLDATAALWPRRLAESYLRSGDGARAAEFFAIAAQGRGGSDEDRAQRALALESTDDKDAAVAAWAGIGEATLASRPEWAASRARAIEAVAARRRVARDAARTAPVRADPCDARSLEALAALPSPDALLAAVGARSSACADQMRWVARATEQAIGVSRFRDALRLVGPRAIDRDATRDVREQYGLLLHWTGSSARAVPVLRAVVDEDPSRSRAADTLIDAYRASGNPDAAWPLAQARWSAPTSSAEHRVAVAALALQTGRVPEALTRARSLRNEASVQGEARAIAAGALVALGRPADARVELGGLRDEPGPGLAWLDAVAMTDGTDAALAAGATIDRSRDGWEDVQARMALWFARMGRRQESDRELAQLALHEPTRATLARADIALADGRPADASALLMPLAAQTPGDLRAVDVLATALAEQERWDEALARLTSLRALRPHDARWRVRDAEWQHRRSPSAERLTNLESIVAEASEFNEGRLALARAYLRAGMPDRAVGVLASTSDRERSEDEAALTARAYRAAGQLERALDVLDQRGRGPVDLQLLRAEIAGALGLRDRVDREFDALTKMPDADPAWFLAWAEALRDQQLARPVVERGVRRFPDDARLQERLAVVAWADRDAAVARPAAERAVAIDEGRLGAWFVLVASSAQPGSSAALVPLLRKFRTRFADSPGALLDMGNLVAGLSGAPGDTSAASEALVWANDIRAAHPAMTMASITRVRLLASLGNLSRATAEIQALVKAQPGLAPAHRVEADLLIRAGRFGEALEACDRYLVLEPGDVDVRRLQARIEGWRGEHAASKARYERLIEAHPTARAIAEEAEAKRLAHGGRWRDALDAYDRWIAIEPREVEAQLERAQVLDRLVRSADAAEAFRRVESHTPGQALAREAADRLARRDDPSAEFFLSALSADSAERRQLLDVADLSAAASWGLGAFGRGRMRAFAGPSVASAPSRRWDGYHAGASLSSWVTPSIEANAMLTWRVLDPIDPQWFGRAAVTWRIADRVRVSGGAERSLILDNGVTLENGLAGAGPVAAMRWTPSASTTVEASARWLSMTDDNARRQFRLDGGQRLWHRVHEFRVVGNVDFLGHDATRIEYFSPTTFWRFDVGVDARYWLKTPRFFGDRERWVSATYLYGWDTREERYHTVRAATAYEFARGAGIVADVSLVRSRVYDGALATFGLRIHHVPTPWR